MGKITIRHIFKHRCKHGREEPGAHVLTEWLQNLIRHAILKPILSFLFRELLVYQLFHELNTCVFV